MNRITRFLFERPEPSVTLAETTERENCVNCNSILTGAYCSSCGQKKITGKDVTVKAFLENILYGFTHIDSKILKSFRSLFRPGYLTEEYISGHRKSYMSPVQLFVVINLLYFIIVSVFNWNTFTVPLQYEIRNGVYGDLIKTMVDTSITELGISFTDYVDKFNYRLIAQAKLLIIIMVPLFSIFLSILFLNQRRYFVEHLVFSLHTYSFIILALGIGINLFFLLLLQLLHLLKIEAQFLDNDSLRSLVASIALYSYLFLSLLRVYKNSFIANLLKSIIAFLAFGIVIAVYRFLLFLSVLYSISLSGH